MDKQKAVVTALLLVLFTASAASQSFLVEGLNEEALNRSFESDGIRFTNGYLNKTIDFEKVVKPDDWPAKKFTYSTTVKNDSYKLNFQLEFPKNSSVPKVMRGTKFSEKISMKKGVMRGTKFSEKISMKKGETKSTPVNGSLQSNSGVWLNLTADAKYHNLGITYNYTNDTGVYREKLDTYHGEEPPLAPIKADNSVYEVGGEIKQSVVNTYFNQYGPKKNLTYIVAVPEGLKIADISTDAKVFNLTNYSSPVDAYNEAERRIEANNLSGNLTINDTEYYRFKAFTLQVPADENIQTSAVITTNLEKSVPGIKTYFLGSIGGTTTYESDQVISSSDGFEGYSDGTSHPGPWTNQYSGSIEVDDGDNYTYDSSAYEGSKFGYYDEGAENLTDYYKLPTEAELAKEFTIATSEDSSQTGHALVFGNKTHIAFGWATENPGHKALDGTSWAGTQGGDYNTWYNIRFQIASDNQSYRIIENGVEYGPFKTNKPYPPITRVYVCKSAEVTTPSSYYNCLIADAQGTDAGTIAAKIDNLGWASNKVPDFDNVNSDPYFWEIGTDTDIGANATDPESDPMTGEYFLDFRNGTNIIPSTSMDNGTTTDFIKNTAFNLNQTGKYTLGINITDSIGNWNTSKITQGIYKPPIKTDTQTEWLEGTLDNVTISIEPGNLTLSATTSQREANTKGNDGSSWNTISTTKTYDNPLVFASSNTASQTQPAKLAKIRNVGSSSFDLKFCEHEDTDGACDSHLVEDVGWAVYEKGEVDSLPGVEAGKVTLEKAGAGNSTKVTWEEDLSLNAIIIAQQQTYNEAGEAIVQVREVGAESGYLYLCDHDESSVNKCEDHGKEEVAWIAVDPDSNSLTNADAGLATGIGSSAWTSQTLSGFSNPPTVVATIQTNNGGQQSKPSMARNITATDMEVRYCEHDSTDTCDGHANEDVGWLAFTKESLSTVYGETGVYKSRSYVTSNNQTYEQVQLANVSQPTATDINVTVKSLYNDGLQGTDKITSVKEGSNNYTVSLPAGNQYIFNVTGSTSNTSKTYEIDSTKVYEGTGDTTPPGYKNYNLNESKIVIGDPVNVSVTATDNNYLSQAQLATNETGSWKNYTGGTYDSPESITGTEDFADFIWSNSSVSNTTIGFKVWIEDSAGLWAVTSVKSVLIGESFSEEANQNIVGDHYQRDDPHTSVENTQSQLTDDLGNIDINPVELFQQDSPVDGLISENISISKFNSQIGHAVNNMFEDILGKETPVQETPIRQNTRNGGEITRENVTDSTSEWKDGVFTNTTVGAGNLSLESIKLETGYVNDISSWTTVNLGNSYNNPVVVAYRTEGADVSENQETSRPQIRNVDGNSFEVRVIADNGTVVAEDVAYAVMEVGHYTIDGVEIEAGTYSVSGTGSQTVSYLDSFPTNTIMVDSPQEVCGSSVPITSRYSEGTMGSSSVDGVYWEDFNGGTSLACSSFTAGYIAVEKGASNSYWESGMVQDCSSDIDAASWCSASFSKSFSSQPAFLANPVESDGADPAVTGIRNLGNTSVDLRATEDDVGDTEQGHATDDLPWLAFTDATSISSSKTRGEYYRTLVTSKETTEWTDFTDQNNGGGTITVKFGVNDTGTWKYYDTVSSAPDSKYLRMKYILEDTGSKRPEVDRAVLTHKLKGFIKENISTYEKDKKGTSLIENNQFEDILPFENTDDFNQPFLVENNEYETLFPDEFKKQLNPVTNIGLEVIESSYEIYTQNVLGENNEWEKITGRESKTQNSPVTDIQGENISTFEDGKTAEASITNLMVETLFGDEFKKQIAQGEDNQQESIDMEDDNTQTGLIENIGGNERWNPAVLSPQSFVTDWFMSETRSAIVDQTQKTLIQNKEGEDTSPQVNWVRVNVTDLGSSSRETTLIMNITDDDGNDQRKYVKYAGYKKEITGTDPIVKLEIGNLLEYDGPIYVEDVNGHQSYWNLAFDITDAAYLQQADTVDLGQQTITKNDTVQNPGSHAFNYSINIHSYEGTVQNSNVHKGKVKPGKEAYAFAKFQGDFLIENTYTWVQDSARQSTVRTQYTSRRLAIENLHGDQWKNVDAPKVKGASGFGDCNICDRNNITFTGDYNNSRFYLDSGDIITNALDKTIDDIDIGERTTYFEQYHYIKEEQTEPINFTDLQAREIIDDSRYKANGFITVSANETGNLTYASSYAEPKTTDSCDTDSPDFFTTSFFGHEWRACMEDRNGNNKPEYFKVEMSKFDGYQEVRYGGFTNVSVTEGQIPYPGLKEDCEEGSEYGNLVCVRDQWRPSHSVGRQYSIVDQEVSGVGSSLGAIVVLIVLIIYTGRKLGEGDFRDTAQTVIRETRNKTEKVDKPWQR